MKEEYYQVLDSCKQALCTIGVKGKPSIEKLLNCILALQEQDMTPEKLSRIINTLNNVTVGGTDSMEIMLNVIVVLEQVRDGTFDINQLKTEE